MQGAKVAIVGRRYLAAICLGLGLVACPDPRGVSVSGTIVGYQVGDSYAIVPNPQQTEIPIEIRAVDSVGAFSGRFYLKGSGGNEGIKILKNGVEFNKYWIHKDAEGRLHVRDIGNDVSYPIVGHGPFSIKGLVISDGKSATPLKNPSGKIEE